jgi:hypothetical protein
MVTVFGSPLYPAEAFDDPATVPADPVVPDAPAAFAAADGDEAAAPRFACDEGVDSAAGASTCSLLKPGANDMVDPTTSAPSAAVTAMGRASLTRLVDIASFRW